jgi:hypothetical protein
MPPLSPMTIGSKAPVDGDAFRSERQRLVAGRIRQGGQVL